ncbi:hypothetical protein AB1Y20_010195 [Prymnesium parvum]|uniref:Guanine nucleotide-binding protein subunit beta-like protein n=1 Tax=Prymnesium parvum TaxID=97485 RepID=A0AB34K6P5_PRYPA
MAGPSHELARLDELREAYTRLLELCHERDQLVTSQTQHLIEHTVAPASGRPHSFGKASLREALRQHPQHFSSDVPRHASTGSARSDDTAEALLQLDEAIGSLLAIALAAQSPPASSSASSHASSAAHEAHARAIAASLCLPLASAHGPAPKLVQPTVFRPFLARDQRLRLCDSACGEAAAAAAAAALPVRLPCGALGATPSLRLQRGDVLHVPFSHAEEAVLRQALAPAAPAEPSAAQFRRAAALLPGRSAEDCARYWESVHPCGDDEQMLVVHSTAPPAEAAPRHSGGAERTAGRRVGRGRAGGSVGGRLEGATPRRAAPAAAAGGRRRTAGGMAALLRTRVPPTPLLMEWARMGGTLGAQRRGTYARYVRRALVCNYQPTSVSCKPTGNVSDLAFSPAGSRHLSLAVGSTEKPHEALLFDLATGGCRTLGRAEGDGHGRTVSAVQFCVGGERVLTSSYDHTVRVWDAADGALLRVLGTPCAAEGTPAGGGAAALAGGGDAEQSLTGIEFEPAGFEDGAAEAVAGAAAAAWAYAGDLPGHADHVFCLAAHPTRPNIAASGGKDSYVVLWDIDRGAAARRIALAQNPLDIAFGCGAADGMVAMGLDVPDDNHAMCSKVCVFDMETGALRINIEQGRGHVSCLHYCNTGDSFLVGGADGVVRQHSSKDGRLMFAYETGMPDVNMVSLSCSGTYVQAAGDKDQAIILDVRRPERALHVLQHDSVGEPVNGVSASWSHLCHSMLVTGSDDSTVRVWDVSLANPLLTKLCGHASPVSCIGLSADDELLASGGDDGKVVLYSVHNSRRYFVGLEQDHFLQEPGSSMR